MANGKRFALCVGINQYNELPPGLQRLEWACADAEEVAELLNERGDFDEVRLLVAPDETTKPKLLEALENLFEVPDLSPDDTIILFFACHATLESGGDLLLVPADGRWRIVNNTVLPRVSSMLHINEIATLVQNCAAQNVVLLIDGCHSGAAAALQTGLKLPTTANFFVLGAALAEQAALETNTLKHGAFTYCLLEGLDNLKPSNPDGWITVTQLQAHISQKLPTLVGVHQLMQNAARFSRDILVVRNLLAINHSGVFQETVRIVLEKNGYQVVPQPDENEWLPGMLLMEVKSGSFTDRQLVLCLDNSQAYYSSGPELIRQFCSWFKQARDNNRCDKGLLITAAAISSEAEQVLRVNGLGLIKHQLISEFEITTRPPKVQPMRDPATPLESYIPWRRNSLYQARPDEFAKLEEYIIRPPDKRVYLGLVGMAGIGKTQLAVELIYRYREHFPDGIFWFSLSGHGYLDWQRVLAEVALRIDYLPANDEPDNPENEARRAHYLARRLGKLAGALVVLDNVENPELMTETLPALAGDELACTVLYTSRSRKTPSGAVSYLLEELPEEAALRLVLETTRPAVLGEVLTGSTTSETVAARTICRSVSYLPAGLNRLRALLAEDTSLSLGQLANALNERGAMRVIDQPDRLPTSLFNSFELSWRLLDDETTRFLFQLLIIFPQNYDIPLWLPGLIAGLGERSEIYEPLGKAVKHLQNLGFVELLTNSLARVKPLLQEFGLELINKNPSARVTFEETAAQRILAVFEDLTRLDVWAQTEGYWACVERVQAAASYAGWLGNAAAQHRLGLLLWHLQRESSLLAGSSLWPEKLPNLFYQQLYNRALEDEQEPVITERSGLWLRQLAPVGLEDRALWRVITEPDFVWTVAFSPDGNYVLTGSEDATARIWEIGTGKLIIRLEGHGAAVSSAVFSADGNRVLTGSHDGSAQLWEVATGKVVTTFDGPAAVIAVAFSHDARLILTGAEDASVTLWEAATGQKLLVLNGHSASVQDVTFSPNDKLVLSGSADNTACLWEVTGGRLLNKFNGHTAPVNAVAFSPDGTKVVTASDDKTVRLWKIVSGELLTTLKNYNAAVSAAVFSPDNKFLATSTRNGSIHLWDTNGGKQLEAFHGHKSAVTSLAFSPTGNNLVSGSTDHTVQLWLTNQNQNRLRPKPPELEGAVRSVSFSVDGQLFLVGTTARDVTVWESASHDVVCSFRAASETVRAVAFSPDKSWIVAASSTTVEVWELASGQLVSTFQNQGALIDAIIVGTDNKTVITGARDGQIRFWDVAGGSSVTVEQAHRGAIYDLALSHSGKLILSGSQDGSIKLWDFDKREAVISFSLPRGTVRSVAFSPDDRLILIGTSDKQVRLWDTISQKIVATQGGHSGSVRNVAFSPDSNFLLTSDTNGEIRLWQNDNSILSLAAFYQTFNEPKAAFWSVTNQLYLIDSGGTQAYPGLYKLQLEAS